MNNHNTTTNAQATAQAGSTSNKTITGQDMQHAFALSSEAEMQFEEVSYRIGTHFVSALMYGDLSGLNRQEAEQIECFEIDVQSGRLGHWDCSTDYTEFDQCDVTGVFGNVVAVSFFYQTAKVEA